LKYFLKGFDNLEAIGNELVSMYFNVSEKSKKSWLSDDFKAFALSYHREIT